MEKNIRKLMMVVAIIATAIALRFAFEYAYRLLNEITRITPLIGFSIRTLFVMLVVAIWLTITVRSENAYQKLPWLLILIVEPLVGIFLYFSMGRSFKNSFRYKNRPKIHDFSYITQEQTPQEIIYPESIDPQVKEIFQAAHHITYHPPYFNSTKQTLLNNGETFYPDLLKELNAAKDFILMEFFIVASDTRGREVLDLLMEKASQGITVKLIYDALGSNRRMKNSYVKKIKASQIDFVINDPIYFPFFNTRVNYRNHRKIIVIDGVIGYTGGMNLADEYDNSIAYDYFFRDAQIKLEGEAVSSLTTIFFKDYYYNTNHFINSSRYFPKKHIPSKGITQILQSGPDSDEAFIRNIYLKMIYNAKKSIKIMTPYMALDQEMLTALKTASLSGLKVDIIIPGTPDKILVYKVTKYYASVLAEHGVNVYKYTKGFAHAKILIVDDDIASVGSYNLDNRSAVIDFEVTALLHGDVVNEIVESFNQDIKDATQVEPRTWQKRPFTVKLIEGILSIFTPII